VCRVAELAVREGDAKAAELVNSATDIAGTADTTLGPFYFQVTNGLAAGAADVQALAAGLGAAHRHNTSIIGCRTGKHDHIGVRRLQCLYMHASQSVSLHSRCCCCCC
jgi:hypothetical protein